MPRDVKVSLALLRRAWEDTTQTSTQIAERFGMSRRTLGKIAKAQGWMKRSRRNVRVKLTPDMVKPMWDFGLISQDIGAYLGVTHHAVNTLAYRHGWRRGKGWHNTGRRTLSEWCEVQLRKAMEQAAKADQDAARRLMRGR
ncbi:hypothetical protein [Roseinatronobacter alkalisoli]|uniref:Uncharacterized protein n=1 Tax=Roseinatronobacter alkalisoli TaxID=3028235 RepID=A0ABT5TFH0_9RHOB|nr:hypothetical protein [Roseinatronobacter sp. HJB301]MDD7973430.1 hypothetical protein [Roseinatronobacter sp. HJB301]